MLTFGILTGLVAGLLAGGEFLRLAQVRLRLPILAFMALGLRFGIEGAIEAGVEPITTLRLPLFVAAFGLLLLVLWINRGQPGFSLAFVGIAGNTIAIVANGGAMPIWEPSLTAAGLGPSDVARTFHMIIPADLDLSFVLHAGPLGDVIPLPIPFLRNVASIGDVFLSGGLAFFMFATLVRTPEEIDETTRALIEGRLGRIASASLALRARPPRSETSLGAGLAEASALERLASLSGPRGSASTPAGSRLPFDADAQEPSLPWSEAAVARVRRHPYVRLALNPSFSALWLGQVISLLGDRLHQVALAFLVLGATQSPAAVGAVFLVAALPNLFLSPIAGTFVDRWNVRSVMVASDLLRAGVVFLIPILATTSLVLVYPLVFVLTAISIFFRPARVAMVPRIVREDELLSANSATWIADTLADVVGYPLAGLFVAFLGSALPLAFWLDAASYVGSALLVASIVVPPLVRARGSEASETRADGSAGARPGRVAIFFAELREGWRFLRGEAILLANTVQATIAQFTVGVLIALTPIYASDFLERGALRPEAAYSFMEAAIGIGNLAGGVVMGLIGARLAKGRAVIAGYVVWGACTLVLAFTGNLALVIGLMIGSGVANMVFIIPSQTLLQERTPAELIGRVMGFRFALVYGAMTIAMGVGGLLGGILPAPVVLGAAGVLTLAAGLGGLLFPAVRDA